MTAPSGQCDIFSRKCNGMVQGNIYCCDYWLAGGCFSFSRKFFTIFEIFGYYRTKKAGCLHQAQLLFFWSTYSELTGCLFMQLHALQTPGTPTWLQHSGSSEHGASLLTVITSELRCKHAFLYLDACHFAMGRTSQDCD